MCDHPECQPSDFEAAITAIRAVGSIWQQMEAMKARDKRAGVKKGDSFVHDPWVVVHKRVAEMMEKTLTESFAEAQAQGRLTGWTLQIVRSPWNNEPGEHIVGPNEKVVAIVSGRYNRA